MCSSQRTRPAGAHNRLGMAGRPLVRARAWPVRRRREGDLSCGDGGFGYTSSGAWDGNGFHAAGNIVDGSGSGRFEDVSGRVAQLKGGGADAGDGTANISYDLVFDTPDG